MGDLPKDRTLIIVFNSFDLSSATNQVKRTANLFTITMPVEIEHEFLRNKSITDNETKNSWLQSAQENLFTLFLSGVDLSGQVDAEKYLPQLQARKAKLIKHLLPRLEFIPSLVNLVLTYP